MEVPTLSETSKPTSELSQESLDPRIIVALFGIESLPSISQNSLPSQKNSGYPTTEKQTTQKFKTLLKEIKDILKSMACSEEKSIDTDSFEENYIPEHAPVLEEKIRGLDKLNKFLLENLLRNVDSEKEPNTKKQEMLLKNQNSKNLAQGFARHLVHCSEAKRVLNETQLNKEKTKCRFPCVQEENSKLRYNMEQLLQEADHWSVQHTELSELIKSYQKSQKDRREKLKKNSLYLLTQPYSEASSKQELEEQVKRLKHDTYSLHLIAALLENECQILEQRVEIFKKLHHQNEGVLQEKLIQTNFEQGKKEQKLLETEREEMPKQKMQEVEGPCHKRDKFFRNLDSCRIKKARNNRFNSRIARRALLGKKRPVSSLR
ncbi:PREDICTED: spermatogenic leucine zipper protein 1 [Condylura cristata]|uniref:spermatogenic leucine zipper protein 1 n=1 Tax=Condylura cristata TaxID=143302 RepID=UPI0006428F77|nr:PREDICTED: spermatogenic leucine zipper protein 1 [Condylura cristata]